MPQLLNRKATAIFVPAMIGLGGGALSVLGFEQYGWSLFLGLPIVVSFLSAFFWTFKRQQSFGSAYGISPEFYWGMVSDEIIHRIHLRVLNHIKQHTETR